MLPIALRGEGRRALIVGGGAVAGCKAETLQAAGFAIRFSHEYRTADLDGVDVVVAASDDPAINQRVVDDARAARILSCDANDPERGDFTMLAFGPQYGAAARTLARMQTYVRTVVPSEERAAVMRELSEMPVEALAAMNPVAAEHHVEDTIERLRGKTAAPTRAAVCATRASALALTQTRKVAAVLAEAGTATTLLNLTTTGDRVQDRPIAAIGTDNVWVKELETALLDGRADYAVHSCKDLPGTLAEGMRIVAITRREDPRDAFCSERYASFDDLPSGAVVGTSSPRRRAQLCAQRPDLRFEDIRGNVDTRLRKLREGRYDAIVLAMAGLKRLGVRATHTVPFDLDRMVPAVAQGALAIETLANEETFSPALRASCNDDITERCVSAERAALRTLHAGCNAPLGVHARLKNDEMTIDGAYAIEERALVLRERVTGRVLDVAQAESLGTSLGRRLAARVEHLNPQLVVLPRTQDRPSRIAAELRLRGVEVIELHDGATFPTRMPDMLVFLSSGSVGVARRYLEALRDARHHPRIAAMGAQSGAAARAAGFAPDITVPEASIEAFVASITEGLNS